MVLGSVATSWVTDDAKAGRSARSTTRYESDHGTIARRHADAVKRIVAPTPGYSRRTSNRYDRSAPTAMIQWTVPSVASRRGSADSAIRSPSVGVRCSGSQAIAGRIHRRLSRTPEAETTTTSGIPARHISAMSRPGDRSDGYILAARKK
jgi:hypothetical protein